MGGWTASLPAVFHLSDPPAPTRSAVRRAEPQIAPMAAARGERRLLYPLFRT